MNFIKPSWDCVTIKPDSYWYEFICKLRKIHKEKWNYEFIGFEEIVSDLSYRLQILLRQDEDLQLLQLLKHNVIVADDDHTQFAIHPTHRKSL